LTGRTETVKIRRPNDASSLADCSHDPRVKATFIDESSFWFSQCHLDRIAPTWAILPEHLEEDQVQQLPLGTLKSVLFRVSAYSKAMALK
jgi:hypothetical protein